MTIVGPASADPPAENAWLMNSSGTLLCLDGSVSQGVRIKACDRVSPYQRWYQIRITAERFELRNAGNSRVCLDGSITSGARMLPCNGNGYQLWTIEQRIRLSNVRYGTARSLDGSVSQGVRMNATASDSVYQAWQFYKP
ncbi:RICIN domain-containing protein [Virgisporangium ochraceum]|uniref:RICIN domain-containing protein n=1 Tax=Virgisporangium ochraceum TaxID=65505 RepID=UPI0019454A08|nr:RICIN domain-containing protein [Virgisporangium ochraceum]